MNRSTAMLRPLGVNVLLFDDGTLLMADYEHDPSIRTRTYSGFGIGKLSPEATEEFVENSRQILAGLQGAYNSCLKPRQCGAIDASSALIAIRRNPFVPWQTVEAHDLDNSYKSYTDESRAARIKMRDFVSQIRQLATVPTNIWRPSHLSIRIIKAKLDATSSAETVDPWPADWPSPPESALPGQWLRICVPANTASTDQVITIRGKRFQINGTQWKTWPLTYVESGWPDLNLDNLFDQLGSGTIGCDFAPPLPGFSGSE
jgi:hypothetical protein